jgi:formylglycine-generating enzyme required for sulfatase activity
MIWSIGDLMKLPINKQTTPTKLISLIKTKINFKDGMEMVLIPKGEFLMGTSEEELTMLLKTNSVYKREWFINEFPQHKVYLDEFYIYKTEVTVAQYRKFCKMTKRKMPPEPSFKWKENHPIVNVTWTDAKAYADWAGVLLPTEAQWEKTVRCDDGRVYPWGNDWNKDNCANLSNSDGENGRTKGTHPVGSFPSGTNPYGVMDLSGNACEWCLDWYGENYYKNSQYINPKGPSTGEFHIRRGGDWGDYYITTHRLRGTYRGDYYPINYTSGVNLGFRCVSPK